MMKAAVRFVRRLERYVKKPWYPILLAFSATLDLFIFVIPIDTLLITSVLSVPRRWLVLSACTTVGFVMGCFLFMLVVQNYGLETAQHWVHGLDHNALWRSSEHWMNLYGLRSIFVVSLLPIALHPLLAIAVLAEVPIRSIILVLLAGRIVKYGALGWIASHSPKLLAKFSFERKEMERILKKEDS